MLAFTVNVDGSLSSLPNAQTVTLGPTIASSGSFLFGGQPGPFGTPLASAQAIFPAGNLHLVSAVDFPVIGGGTINFVTPCGKEVFAGDDLNALAPFAVGAQGSLSLDGPATTYVGTPWNVAADPTCTFLYLPDTNSANLYAFQNANGLLSLVSGSPFTAGSAVAGKGLFGVSMDPSGKFLYVPNQTEMKLYGFAIGSDGTLTPVAGSPFATAGAPVATLAVSLSSASFLYVTDSANNVVTSYRIDSMTGGLTQAGSAAAGSQPSYLAAVDNLLYSTNVQGGNISGFVLKSDGTMTPAPGSPFAIGSQPVSGAAILTGTLK